MADRATRVTKMASATVNHYRPTGLISERLQGHGVLARRYFDFLDAADPLERWEDVAPLSVPISVGKDYPINWDLVRNLSPACPSLAESLHYIEYGNTVAPQLGLRYAWSRFEQHSHLMDAIEDLFLASDRGPKLVMEPGCFS